MFRFPRCLTSWSISAKTPGGGTTNGERANIQGALALAANQKKDTHGGNFSSTQTTRTQGKLRRTNSTPPSFDAKSAIQISKESAPWRRTAPKISQSRSPWPALHNTTERSGRLRRCLSFNFPSSPPRPAKPIKSAWRCFPRKKAWPWPCLSLKVPFSKHRHEKTAAKRPPIAPHPSLQR